VGWGSIGSVRIPRRGKGTTAVLARYYIKSPGRVSKREREKKKRIGKDERKGQRRCRKREEKVIRMSGKRVVGKGRSLFNTRGGFESIRQCAFLEDAKDRDIRGKEGDWKLKKGNFCWAKTRALTRGSDSHGSPRKGEMSRSDQREGKETRERGEGRP